MKKAYIKPEIETFGSLETVVLTGKSSSACRTDCR